MLKKLLVITITATTLLTSACGALLAPTRPAAPRVPNTVVIELTWDQWTDIQCAIVEIEISTEDILDTNISNALLDHPGTRLDLPDIEEARDLITRYKAIEDTLSEQADAQTASSPRKEWDAVYQYQFGRAEKYFNLRIILAEAVKDWWEWDAQQTEKKERP